MHNLNVRWPFQRLRMTDRTSQRAFCQLKIRLIIHPRLNLPNQ
uniref:Uncharacterized protein n=1 Tax=Anguilla anguilla TaxID=7936 RepID=A0A0E9UHM1_ANGAN